MSYYDQSSAAQWRHSKAANYAVIITSLHSVNTKEALSIEHSSFFHPPQLMTPICAMASVK